MCFSIVVKPLPSQISVYFSLTTFGISRVSVLQGLHWMFLSITWMAAKTCGFLGIWEFLSILLNIMKLQGETHSCSMWFFSRVNSSGKWRRSLFFKRLGPATFFCTLGYSLFLLLVTWCLEAHVLHILLFSWWWWPHRQTVQCAEKRTFLWCVRGMGTLVKEKLSVKQLEVGSASLFLLGETICPMYSGYLPIYIHSYHMFCQSRQIIPVPCSIWGTIDFQVTVHSRLEWCLVDFVYVFLLQHKPHMFLKLGEIRQIQLDSQKNLWISV